MRRLFACCSFIGVRHRHRLCCRSAGLCVEVQRRWLTGFMSAGATATSILGLHMQPHIWTTSLTRKHRTSINKNNIFHLSGRWRPWLKPQLNTSWLWSKWRISLPPNTKCSVLANFDYFCWPDTSDRIFLQSWISFTHRDGKVPMKKVSKRRLLKYKTKNPRQTVIRTWTWGNGWIRLDATVMQLRCHVSSVRCAATRGRRRFEFQDICFVVCNWGLNWCLKHH